MVMTELVVTLITADFCLCATHYTSLCHDTCPKPSHQARYIKLVPVGEYYSHITKALRLLEIIECGAITMFFQCRSCGKVSEDIDQVLEGTCDCGCTHFKLLSEQPLQLPTELEMKETIRQDLHRWIDLNLDSMSPEQISNIRVSFESDGSKKTQFY